MDRKPDYGGPTAAFSTRNLRVDLIERLRVLAALWDCTMSEALNVCLRAGVEAKERSK